MFTWFKRRRALGKEMPAHWQDIVSERCSFAKAFVGDERKRFFDHLRVFALTKTFIGVKGQEITDEVRVVISASAARLVRQLPLTIYDPLTEVIVYPSTFTNPNAAQDDDYSGHRLGEAHRWGVVVLSWDAVKHGIGVGNDGHDVALHEFAHVLDIVDGAFDGTPPLQDRAELHAWALAFTGAFERLRKSPGRHVMNDYGATNEAEFFAVATETFFEKPRALKRSEPELYDVLQDYYGVDPLSHRR